MTEAASTVPAVRLLRCPVFRSARAVRKSREETRELVPARARDDQADGLYVSLPPPPSEDGGGLLAVLHAIDVDREAVRVARRLTRRPTGPVSRAMGRGDRTLGVEAA